MFWTVVLGLLLVFFLWELLRSDCPNKSRPGKFYYTKKWLFRAMMWLNSRRQQKDAGSKVVHTDRMKRGYGTSICDPKLLELCQPLEEDNNAIDTTYFNGFDTDGISLALRIARKHNREGELWVMLDLPGVGFLQHPIHPDAGVYNMGEGIYSASGCQFKVIEPMRSWRVIYNGLLRWECINDPFNFDVDLDRNLLADAVAKEKWTKQFWEKLRGKHQTHYEQCGELDGTIEIEGHEPRKVFLKSYRDHTFGVRNWEMFQRYAVHYIWIEEMGIMAMVAVLWMPDYITLLRTGYLMYANGDTYPVTAVNLDIESLTQDKHPPERYSFTFEAAEVCYHVLCVAMVTPEIYHYRKRTSRVLERFCTYKVNGKSARGLTEFHYRNPEGPAMSDAPTETVPLLREPALSGLESEKGQITLSFQSEGCKSSVLVGGKGSQLAFLSSIQEQVDGKVSRGFCLTLEAFELQLRENPNIAQSLDQIVETIRQDKLTELKTLCSTAEELLVSCKISQPIESSLTSELMAVFGETYEKTSLAIRSSAAGEDGIETSSAGQMETFLGVQGTANILDNVRKCWASAYTFQAVEYRRQHGQPVLTSMGVVIQEMVQSEVSGVIFTNDPFTGNTHRMVLDASYGLGEVVVSGKTTPDTIIIQRYPDNHLDIVERRLGNKGIRMKVAESGGTCEVETSTVDKEHCCMTDQQILQLAKTAIQVEAYFGSGRDIEWALCDKHIYLLQARPITTTDQETDEDLIHEFDTPVVTGQERLTIGNIGEMMPGCVTTLTGSIFGRAVDSASSTVGADFGGGTVMKYASKFLPSNCGRLFINLTYSGRQSNNSLLFQKKSLELTLIGEILSDHTEHMIELYGRVQKSFFLYTRNMINFFVSSGRVYMNSLLYQKKALEMNLIGAILEDHTLEMIRSYGKIKNSFLVKIRNTVNFFLYLEWLGCASPLFKSYKKKAEINLCGHELDDHSYNFVKLYGKSVSQKWSTLFRFWATSNRKIKVADSWYDKLQTYHIGPNCSTSAQLYQAIIEKLPDYYEIWETTIHKSARSGIYGGVVMGIVAGGKEEWSTENYSDVALLLSQCQNVYSAEVPSAMKAIARCIKDEKLYEEFVKKSDKECVVFLRSDTCPASVKEKYVVFLKRHGHRCVREAEFLEKSWRAEPEKLMKVLKSILKTSAYSDPPVPVLSLEEAVGQIKSPVSWLGKLILRKWIVPKARKGVGEREFGKSVAVDVSDRFKQAYWRLADMLFTEGRLPERELMFFLTHTEIGHLIETRSARLVTKAIRRRKLLPVQSDIEFPRICVGRPKHIEKQGIEEERKASFTLTGMPVSRGSVKGPARVVKSLQDADQIQRGDILIVSYTDVGWSPYFPLIAGLVTELGGLVSHGAVVAREYGLPCVVNVPGATASLQTGDFVHLDGSKGSIQKLETVE